MIYRLTSGKLIGQIINDKKYSALPFHYKCVFEPVQDIATYEFSIFITNNRGACEVVQHVFDFESEVEQFLQESGHFLPEQIDVIKKGLYDEMPLILIETPVRTIKYTRQLTNGI